MGKGSTILANSIGVLSDMMRCIFLIFSLCTIGNQVYASKQEVHSAKIFKPFTGKISGNKVRLRSGADFESHIIKQLNKNDLLLIVGEENEFYAVEPPKDTKAYVFRSYILDGLVEANRVNVRLEPHADAPIISQLEAGQKVDATVCPLNNKWLEILPPRGTKFYVSKEYVVSVGGPEYLATMETRKEQVNEILKNANTLAEIELKKDFEDMSILTATEQFQSILRSYPDFPEAISAAKDGIAQLKETYLNKKIAYLESREELPQLAKEELIAKHKEQNKLANIDAESSEQSHPNFWAKPSQKKEQSIEMLPWEVIEESLYLSWTAFHSGKKIDDFYAEQKANGTVLSGKIEPYTIPIKDKPGSHILRGTAGPIAYLYSTHVDLSKLENQYVTVVASPRPNHHFAFPAFFVLSSE